MTRNRAIAPLVWISRSLAGSLPIDLSWPTGSARILLRRDLASCLEELRREAPALVLVDLGASTPADLELLPTLRGWYPTLPVAVSFPPGKRDLAAAAVRQGATHYVPEPFGSTELLLWLARAMGAAPASAPPAPAPTPQTPPPAPPGAEDAVSSDEALGILVRGLSHEVRNPLATILGAAELRGEAGAPNAAPEEQREIRDTIEAATRIRNVLHDLQVAVEGVVPGDDRVDCNDLLRELRRERIASKAARSSAMILQLGEGLPAVAGSRELLGRAFGAILDNALEAIREPTASLARVRIVTRGPATGPVDVAVHDGGPGIRPEDRARVQLPFFSTRDMGTGLGLSLAAGILRSHGATLRLETSPDGGACVAVTLRRAP